MKVRDIIRKGCVVDAEDPLSKLLGKCRRAKHFYGVIQKQSRYHGMADKRKCLRANLDQEAMKIKSVAVRAPTLSPEQNLEEAAKLFFTADLHALAVLDDNKKVKGIVQANDVLYGLKSAFRGVKVEELASPEVISLPEDATIKRIISICRRKKIGRIPIVNKKDKLIGICTIEDLIYRYHLFPAREGSRLPTKSKRWNSLAEDRKGELPALNIMNELLWTVKPRDSVTKVVDLFHEHEINSLVVARNNVLEGIITAKDLLRFLCS